MNLKYLASIMLIAEIVHYGTSKQLYIVKIFPEPPGSCMTIECQKPEKKGVDIECDKKFIKNGEPDGYSFFLKKVSGEYQEVNATGYLTFAIAKIEQKGFIIKFTRIGYNGKTTDICCATDKKNLSAKKWRMVNSFCNEKEYKKINQTKCPE